MLRDFIKRLKLSDELVVIKKPVSRKFVAAGIMKELDGKPVLFESIKGSNFKVVGNVFSTRELIGKSLGIPKEKLLFKIAHAIDNPSEPQLVEKAPCHEVVEEEVDLNKLPILTHCKKDGGPYVTSGVIVAKDPKLGRNCSFHRLMQLDKRRFVMRILPRHLNEFIKRNGGELDVAVCIGNSVNFLLGGATSVELGFDEMTIANTLEKLPITYCKSVDIEVPAYSEFVLEGRITKELVPEGPFVDLTETYDVIREQNVLEVKKITHRKDALYHALLSGCNEHKLLMGIPREPTIFREVNKVCECRDVGLTLGGCSWLHAVVKIRKRKEDDGKRAIEAAFKGHASLKHVVVVDNDIDIYNPLDVEWAVATRFQAKDGLVVKPHEKGSSLDPSANPFTRETSKMGLDATAPLKKKLKDFRKAEFPRVRLGRYL
ncbi:MAG: 3-octaprenyl-4-hydroxybenzoate carboxy-lyase [Candidatus Fermentimicrarchaeum limneticum]|uniref:Anhydromevalonate phosphate decarboxylase n=1 Tax=Fermentimicrarchaeum limneticum TaxID=2795018 RepID=A0A7D5XE58_FERL1|nr:MAG: 3-octaprenyl-4-hydroxybenzoate carboxy-lyase [Candidatus Fermentimicrarchaeum limneticum]